MTLEQIGRYKIVSLIGQGGMGIVYLAHDPHIDRQVAIKLLSGQFLSDAKYRARFQREARTIARLDHPVIVPIYDFGNHNNQPYIVMRYMSGGSLVEWVRQGRLPLETAVPIVNRVATTLAEVHQQGIIHRDLKPSNILLDNRGDAYLSDFGIVKLNDATISLTGSSVLGTPAYMSPEQIRNDETLDHRTDIYALGVILFEMLTGKRPFAGETILEQIIAHTTKPIPNIYDFNQDLPRGLDTIIQKTMAKDPPDRYHSMTELVQQFNTILGISPPAIQINTEKTERTLPAKPASKLPNKALIAGVGISLILVMILFIWPGLLPVASNDIPPTATQNTTVLTQTTTAETSAPTATLATKDDLSTTAVSEATGPTQAAIINPAPTFHIISTKNYSLLSAPEANLGLGSGQTTLLGIPFEHGWKISTQCELGGRERPTLVSVDAINQTATKIHILLQAGQGLIAFSDQKIGEFVIIFNNGQSYAEPLILGENIRDWRSAMPDIYVNNASATNLQEAWRGKEGNTDGRIDLLTITLPDALQNQPIREFQIIDTSAQTTEALDPCIHLIAVTLESQPQLSQE